LSGGARGGRGTDQRSLYPDMLLGGVRVGLRMLGKGMGVDLKGSFVVACVREF
jgi:hypothetical protein